MALLEAVFDNILPPLADVRLQLPAGFAGTWKGWASLCRFPLSVWNGLCRGALPFCGQVHARMPSTQARGMKLALLARSMASASQ